MRDLAQLYVNWYIRKEHAMNGDELMRTAGDVLEQAFEKPANLEEYLGAKPSHNDVRALQTAIKATIRSNTDDVSEIIYDVLKNDDDVMAEFRKQATAQLDDEFEKHKQVLCKQLDELRAQRMRNQKRRNKQLHSWRSSINNCSANVVRYAMHRQSWSCRKRNNIKRCRIWRIMWHSSSACSRLPSRIIP